MIALRAGAATDVGLVRTNNQDDLLVASPLFAVADGMGGAAAGEVASSTAIEALRAAFERAGDSTSEALLDAAQAANRAVWEKAEANPEMRGMGTTLVALAAVDGDRLAVINVGDSRLYTLHHDELEQITADHNLVAELVAEGQISKEAAEVHPRRNILTRALGVDPEVPVDLLTIEAEPGDRFLLCSDGLPREVRDDRIATVLRRLADPEEAAKELVHAAIAEGGNDNVTVVVVDVVDPDKEVAPAPAVATDSEPEAVETPPPAAARTRSRIITARVVAFVIILLLLLGAAAAGIAWYARGGYYVGVRDGYVTIFQGRPGGLLWFKPTVKAPTSVPLSQVLEHNWAQLQAGQTEPSLTAAHQYVNSLVVEWQQAQAVLHPKPAPAPKRTPPRTTTTTVKKPTTSTTR